MPQGRFDSWSQSPQVRAISTNARPLFDFVGESVLNNSDGIRRIRQIAMVLAKLGIGPMWVFVVLVDPGGIWGTKNCP